MCRLHAGISSGSDAHLPPETLPVTNLPAPSTTPLFEWIRHTTGCGAPKK
jgi:hypothetical protein